MVMHFRYFFKLNIFFVFQRGSLYEFNPWAEFHFSTLKKEKEKEKKQLNKRTSKQSEYTESCLLKKIKISDGFIVDMRFIFLTFPWLFNCMFMLVSSPLNDCPTRCSFTQVKTKGDLNLTHRPRQITWQHWKHLYLLMSPNVACTRCV